jgi:hypothetical protein
MRLERILAVYYSNYDAQQPGCNVSYQRLTSVFAGLLGFGCDDEIDINIALRRRLAAEFYKLGGTTPSAD